VSTLKETVFAGRNNAIRLALSEDGVLFQTAYPDVTPLRWVLTIEAETPVEIDSDVSAGAFDWDSETSVLELRLGSLVSEALSYTLCTLVMYSVEWPAGLVWFNPTCTPDKLSIRVCTLT
jgi:hypothetical protein